jgi:DNA-binding response OmpR family regulator
MARVLVVDDDPDILALVQFRLRKEGHDVVACGDGASALAAVDAGDAHPDAAVLDVSMPNMSGLALLGELRRREGLENLPAIFLSARIHPEDIHAGQKLGATYLTKPFIAPALVEAVRVALREGSGGRDDDAEPGTGDDAPSPPVSVPPPGY